MASGAPNIANHGAQLTCLPVKPWQMTFVFSSTHTLAVADIARAPRVAVSADLANMGVNSKLVSAIRTLLMVAKPLLLAVSTVLTVLGVSRILYPLWVRS